MPIKALPLSFFFLFTLLSFFASGQKIVSTLQYEEGTHQYGEGFSLGKTPFGYTLLLPENEPPRGFLVFFHAQPTDAPLDSIAQYALEKRIGVAYLATDNRLEFFFEKEKMEEVANYLVEIVDQYPATAPNLLFAGMSLEGTRALKLTRYLYQNKQYSLAPNAILICDAPLDMLRFYTAAKKAAEGNFQAVAANEGSWVMQYLQRSLGTPEKNREAYLAYSPYSYQQMDNDYLAYLDYVHLWAYTEPDVQWWMETRRKSYYEMNSVDLAGLVNELNIRGNQNARLFTTQNKGVRPDGSKHPHSWSIVEDKKVMEEFAGLLE
jgi:hypothetical protein